ncbi:MAG: hypothetical protein ACI915_005309, partial [Gammaproteobacteria bacterium]
MELGWSLLISSVVKAEQPTRSAPPDGKQCNE